MFDCQKQCVGTDGQFNDKARASMNCKRVDLPVVQPKRIEVTPCYLGRQPDRRLQNKEVDGFFVIDWEHPPDSIEDNGCPASYYMTPFIASLVPYLRRRTESGDRVQNHMLDRCDDKLVHEAVRRWENEDERARGYQMELVDRKTRSKSS